jgi:hypothetical protein
LLILQLIIKQWDKSQRSPVHIKLRATIPDRYRVILPPAFYAFDQQCIIDQQGDDLQGNRLNYSLDTNGKLLFDRFQINFDHHILTYLGDKSMAKLEDIGSLNNQWLQCHYNSRYAIYQSGYYYWLYEAVTLNAIHLNQLDEHIFLTTQPAIIYKDINDLDIVRKPI